ncbi:MAG: M48 family metallopeptidase [Bacteroidales bacterium]|nr:M48 family metallopeptidase [Bacteroidales bacterium]
MMTHEYIYWLIIFLLVISYVFEQYLEFLNHKSLYSPIPECLQDIYEPSMLEKQRAYHNDYYRFELKHECLFFFITLIVFAFQLLGKLDIWLRSYIQHEFLLTLTFFSISGLIAYLLSLPFTYYETFIIEQKYGFNTTTKRTFLTDQLKSIILTILIGIPLLWIIFHFYSSLGEYFWIYAWLVVLAFSMFFTFFYSKLIVPLFNKQTPLPEGELKDTIRNFCFKVNFPIREVYVIDASKRSKKANAYFTGFGKFKRIVLYDTLIEQLQTDEIVAVLSHEIGHYKHKHIIKTFVLSNVQTLFTLYILSLFINQKEIALAIGTHVPSFHIGIISFGILFSPISTIISIGFNYLSRLYENQADEFSFKNNQSDALIKALKKLSRTNYSHLTPHPLYVIVYYSHPPLYERIKQLSRYECHTN